MQHAQVGTSDKWSAKDILAHIALWQAHRVQEYQMLERGETPPELRGDKEGNEINFHAHRDQPWSAVIAAAESASIGFLALLEGFSDADLTTPDRLTRRNEPLWREFHSTGYVHPVGHYADFYVEHGEIARAAALHQQLAKGTASVGGDDSRGVADYNLACFYAKTGQKDLALGLLPGALKLAPRLVEWSKEDADLLSLHGETAYQALYT